MKKFCVIGLGNFGFHVARTLYEAGHEVMAVDTDKEKAQQAHDHASYVIVGDAADKDFLLGQGVQEMEAVVVATGERSHLSTLITLYLKEMEVKQILVKAVSEDHGRILSKIGADEVIYPEKDMAAKIARGLSQPNILDVLPLAEDYSISEVAPPPGFVGKNLIELDLRSRFDVTVIGIKDVITDEFTMLPPPTQTIKDSDLLVLIGRSEDIEKVCGD